MKRQAKNNIVGELYDEVIRKNDYILIEYLH